MNRASEVEELEIQLLLDAIFARYQYDFRNYARSSLLRRLCLARTAIGASNFSELQGVVLRDAGAFNTLLSTLSVATTELFRDPRFFLAFRRCVVPELRDYSHIRLWVAGCSTGEEAYSLAMILREEGLLERCQIYATDVNPRSLEQAERGTFPTRKLKDYMEAHRQTGAQCSLIEHCRSSNETNVLFAESVREHIIFSDHSLATDSVFAEVQVVTCRNVLIYFNRTLQARALDMFRRSLARRGFLGLGTAETAASNPELELLPDAEKWFRRR